MTNTDKTVAERLAVADALEEFAMIDECEGGNPLVIATERRAAELLREASRTQEPAEWQVEAATWLDEAAGYFERRPNDGEDMAFWANVTNAKFCQGLAARLRAASITPPYERLVTVMEMLRDKHSSPTGTDEQCGAWDMAQRLIGVVRNYQQATPPAPERSKEEVGVKVLEWAELTSPREDGPPEPTGDVEAATMIGEYSVCFDSDEDVSETPWCCWGPNENIGHFADPSEAKAAAQADYEQRIRSALEPASLHKGEEDHGRYLGRDDYTATDEGHPLDADYASPAPLPVTVTPARIKALEEALRGILVNPDKTSRAAARAILTQENADGQ